MPQDDMFFADVRRLLRSGVAVGCGCPLNPNTRGQMAVFLVKTFGFP